MYRLLTVVILTLLYGGDRPNGEPERVTTSDSTSLNLSIVKYDESYCLGSFIAMTVELVNRSNEPVVVDSRGLGRTGSLKPADSLVHDGHGVFRGYSMWIRDGSAEPSRGYYRVLKPGKKLRRHIELADSLRHQLEPGYYDLEAGYSNHAEHTKNGAAAFIGSIYSQGVRIRLDECE